jgi:DNA polymerase-3 subunit beta
MQVTVDAAQLAAALKLAAKVAGARTSMPVLRCAVLEARAGALAVRATDLEVTVATAIGADVAMGGALAVPVAELLGAIGGAKGVATLTLFGGTWLRVQCDGAETAIAGESVSEFPAEPDPVKGRLRALYAAELRDAFAAVACAMSRDPHRPNLCGVYVEDDVSRERSVLVATDGHRLALTRMSRWGKSGVFVPRRLVELFAAIVPKGAATAHVKASAKDLAIECAGTTLHARIPEVEFPNWRQVVPTEERVEHVVEVDRLELLKLLKRIEPMAHDRSKAIRVRANGALTVTANHPERGEASGTVACRWPAPREASRSTALVPAGPVYMQPADVTLGFNARYLTDALRALESGPRRVRLELTGEDSPTVLCAVGAEDGARHVVMPMRLGDAPARRPFHERVSVPDDVDDRPIGERKYFDRDDDDDDGELADDDDAARGVGVS